MQTMVIFNPFAAKGVAGKKWPHIQECLKNAAIDFEIAQTEYSGHATELARSAVASGYRRIVAVGGDGTINEVVNGLLAAEGDAEMAIIPAGTCNDFIKAVKIPKDIRASCNLLRSGKVKRFDVARVGDRYCVNAAGIGFDVAVVQTLQKSKILQGFAMYLAAVFRNLFDFEGMDLTLVNGSTHFERKALMLTVANGVCYGGNFKIAPMADAADGKLNAILLRDMSPIKRLRTLLRFFNGSHIRLKETEMFLTDELTIKANQPLVLQIEGELMEWPDSEIQITLEPKRLKVVVP